MVSRDVHIDQYPHIMLDTPANSIVQQVKGIRPDLLTRFIPQVYFIYTQSDMVKSLSSKQLYILFRKESNTLRTIVLGCGQPGSDIYPFGYFKFIDTGEFLNIVVALCAILRSDRIGQPIIKILGNIRIGRDSRSTRNDNLRYHIAQIMATPIYTDHSDGFDNSSIQ